MEACEITVRVQPRARTDEIVGERDGVLIVRVRAPALEGRANDALCRLIATRARLGRRRVSVVQGAHHRQKRVRVEGVSAAALRSSLGLDPGE